MRAVVMHGYYGCDTGCCGHVVELGEDGEEGHEFLFEHQGTFVDGRFVQEDVKTFVERVVTEAFGAEHVADIDWDACYIVND